MPIPPQYRPQRPGLPTWVYIAAGGGLLAGGYIWWKNKQNNANSAVATNSASAPTLESTGFMSGITDTSNNLPYEDTWPYNQLALPYNYNPSNAQMVSNNANFLLPNQPGFVGNQMSPVG